MIAPEEAAFDRYGVAAADPTRRYWRHPARYGEASFDVFEIARDGERRKAPSTAPLELRLATARSRLLSTKTKAVQSAAGAAGARWEWPRAQSRLPLMEVQLGKPTLEDVGEVGGGHPLA